MCCSLSLNLNPVWWAPVGDPSSMWGKVTCDMYGSRALENVVVPLQSFFVFLFVFWVASTVALLVDADFFVFVINFVSFRDTLVPFTILLPHRDILVHAELFGCCFPGLHCDFLHAYVTFFARCGAFVYGLVRRWLPTELTLSPLEASYWVNVEVHWWLPNSELTLSSLVATYWANVKSTGGYLLSER